MSETQPELEQPTQPDPEPATETTEPAGDPIGHAVYDVTLQRFVGGVHSTKAKADKAVAKVKGHKYETRRV